jgi:hypothetical protein
VSTFHLLRSSLTTVEGATSTCPSISQITVPAPSNEPVLLEAKRGLVRRDFVRRTMSRRATPTWIYGAIGAFGTLTAGVCALFGSSLAVKTPAWLPPSTCFVAIRRRESDVYGYAYARIHDQTPAR